MLVYRLDNHTEDHPTLATAAKQLAMAGKWGEEGRLWTTMRYKRYVR